NIEVFGNHQNPIEEGWKEHLSDRKRLQKRTSDK
ncbi:unnamed protein product, partial [marine sediment metagenome]